jgi:hypothetical protein
MATYIWSLAMNNLFRATHMNIILRKLVSYHNIKLAHTLGKWEAPEYELFPTLQHAGYHHLLNLFNGVGDSRRSATSSSEQSLFVFVDCTRRNMRYAQAEHGGYV